MYKTPEVVILNGNVLCCWCKVWTCGNLDATLIVFVDSPYEHGFSKRKIKYRWDFLQNAKEHTAFLHDSGQCNVFVLGCAERNFCLKLDLPFDWIIITHDYNTGSWQDCSRSVMFAIFLATYKVFVNITFKVVWFVRSKYYSLCQGITSSLLPSLSGENIGAMLNRTQ